PSCRRHRARPAGRRGPRHRRRTGKFGGRRHSASATDDTRGTGFRRRADCICRPGAEAQCRPRCLGPDRQPGVAAARYRNVRCGYGGSGRTPGRRRKAGAAPLWTPELVHGPKQRQRACAGDCAGDRQRKGLGTHADARQLRDGEVARPCRQSRLPSVRTDPSNHMAAQIIPSDGPATPAEDDNPEETREWLESLEAVVLHGGHARGAYLLKQLEMQARQLGIVANALPYSAYRNSIPLELQTKHPGDVAMEERITAMVRWNALAMVIRANKAYGE